MKVDLVFTHIPVAKERWTDRVVVMIDVLRASTSICVALNNGAKTVIPVDSVPEAMEMAGNLFRDNVILCGEQEGKLIDGFDLGNSPLEYSRDKVENRSLIFATTNGSRALVKAGNAKSAIVCGLVNISACVDYILEKKDDILIVCAGNDRQFSMEDTVCGGMLLHILNERVEEGIELNDGAEAALTLFGKYEGRYIELLRNTSHGKYLLSIGFEKDIAICGGVDTIHIVPVYEQGKVFLRDS